MSLSLLPLLGALVAPPAAAMPPNPAVYNDHLVGQQYALARGLLLHAAVPVADRAAVEAALTDRCAQIDSLAGTMAKELPFMGDPSLRDALVAALQAQAAVCREDLVPFSRMLSTPAMTEAVLKEADGLYMAALTEEAEIHKGLLQAQASFAKRHRFVVGPPVTFEPARPALPELPETGLGLDDPLVAAAALQHHNHMITQMNLAIEAINGLLAKPMTPGSDLAEALPGAVTRVARARAACDEAGPWFDDETMLAACVKVTNGVSRLMSAPLAELSLLSAEERWSGKQQRRALALIDEINGELPMYISVIGPASGEFQKAWGSHELIASWAAQGAAPPAPQP